MRTRFFSDNGAPCWRCKSTAYGYVVDDAVTYVSACCLECGHDNMFYPAVTISSLDQGEAIAIAHREASS